MAHFWCHRVILYSSASDYNWFVDGSSIVIDRPNSLLDDPELSVVFFQLNNSSEHEHAAWSVPAVFRFPCTILALCAVHVYTVYNV